MSERKQILSDRTQISISDIFDGRTLDEAITTLIAAIPDSYAYGAYAEGHQVKFATEYYGYDGGIELYVEVYRPENDEELAERLALEEAMIRVEAERAAAKEAIQRAQYERLKKKFEGT